MNVFELQRASDVEDALRFGASGSGPASAARFIAGGTTMVDLMRLDVERPTTLVDINHLPLAGITLESDGGLRIGAMARNADVAHHPGVIRDYPVLSQALLSGASAQLRNAATTGGNVLQRTRCVYFRDVDSPCNKREPGSGCPALSGYNRNLAVLGTSKHCIATNASDQNVALMTLDASLELQSAGTTRSVAFLDFFVLPGDHPETENVLHPGELIVAVHLPAARPGSWSRYLKLRDRASYEFALASTAVSLTFDGEKMDNVRVALGGVGTRPWPALEAEHLLEGQPPSPALFRRAAEAAMRDAVAQSENGFKIELAKRCITAVLADVTSDRHA